MITAPVNLLFKTMFLRYNTKWGKQWESVNQSILTNSVLFIIKDWRGRRRE